MPYQAEPTYAGLVATARQSLVNEMDETDSVGPRLPAVGEHSGRSHDMQPLQMAADLPADSSWCMTAGRPTTGS